MILKKLCFNEKRIINTTIMSIGLLLNQQVLANSGLDTIKKLGANYSHQEMAEILTKAKEELPPRFKDRLTDKYRAKHKKYKENPEEPFSWWEDRIYNDLTKNYKKLFTQNITPNIDATIARTDLDPNTKVGFLINIESKYSEKAAILVWNNLISKRPDSKNARSAFCKVTAETASIKGQGYREKRGEICDKDFQLDPVKHFKWAENATPEVVNSVLIAPKLK